MGGEGPALPSSDLAWVVEKWVHAGVWTGSGEALVECCHHQTAASETLGAIRPVSNSFHTGLGNPINKNRNIASILSTFYNRIQRFLGLEKYSFENIEGTRENAGNQHFLLFPQPCLRFFCFFFLTF